MSEISALIDYSYTQTLTKEQWAWEFMRRNKEYQKDYQWFITQWRALEKDYGRSPNMDYQAWKQDPRSYKIIDISSEQDGNCAISDDKLLIECWMGNKWGFFQFPQSPKLSALDVDITWRPLPPDYKVAENPAETNKNKVVQSIEFDLSKPLKEQLEKAKQQVIISQRRLRKQGNLTPFTLIGKKNLWMACIKMIDTYSNSDNDLLEESGLDKSQVNREAEYYLKHYLNILSFMDK
ncbi:MAG: DUF6499 domain-containing protein [Gammaproteobacteria bacterium]|nr:DUF6499 domain-containing protein [Gammaproteobacteria bacterium]